MADVDVLVVVVVVDAIVVDVVVVVVVVVDVMNLFRSTASQLELLTRSEITSS